MEIPMLKALKAGIATSVMTKRVLTTVATVGLVACVAPTSENDATGSNEEAIVGGTPVTLAQNSFVRLPTPACTGVLLTNRWVLTANHCTSHVGDPVLMDAQSTTVDRVVPHPDVFYGVDIALLHLSSPITAAGTSTNFRRGLRATVAPPGTHVRCFGYGMSYDAPGIGPQMRLMELGTAGGANNMYLFERNSLGQWAAPGDAGGPCLDDTGAVLAVMRSFTWAPTRYGETAAVTSQYYATWANAVVTSCSANSDCSTGICNTVTHRCVSSYCQDGVKDHGETGVDCGGPCVECNHCGGLFDCGDGHCVKWPGQCP